MNVALGAIKGRGEGGLGKKEGEVLAFAPGIILLS
jgi:hypothetical protein